MATLEGEITIRLEAVVGDLPARVIAQLKGILGALFPELKEGKTSGSDLVLGITVTNDGGGGGGGGGGGKGTTETTLGPGDGKAWGQSHKKPHGGWGGPPPWAKAWGHRG